MKEKVEKKSFVLNKDVYVYEVFFVLSIIKC